MPEKVETKQHSNEFERRHIEHDGNDEAKGDENDGGTRVTPAEKRMEALKLGNKICKESLDSAS